MGGVTGSCNSLKIWGTNVTHFPKQTNNNQSTKHTDKQTNKRAKKANARQKRQPKLHHKLTKLHYSRTKLHFKEPHLLRNHIGIGAGKLTESVFVIKLIRFMMAISLSIKVENGLLDSRVQSLASDSHQDYVATCLIVVVYVIIFI